MNCLAMDQASSSKRDLMERKTLTPRRCAQIPSIPNSKNSIPLDTGYQPSHRKTNVGDEKAISNVVSHVDSRVPVHLGINLVKLQARF